jgi:hypothetical protein
MYVPVCICVRVYAENGYAHKERSTYSHTLESTAKDVGRLQWVVVNVHAGDMRVCACVCI